GGAPDGELNVLGIGEGIGKQETWPCFLASLRGLLDPHRERDLVESSLHVRERRPPCAGGGGSRECRPIARRRAPPLGERFSHQLAGIAHPAQRGLRGGIRG